MKRIARRLQTLNERAAELSAAAGQLPNRVAEIREAMSATTEQLQTLKSDIQVNVADLKVEHEHGLSQAIAEIAGHATVIAEAGFLLDGLDVEISPIQRIVIQLVRFKDVDATAIQPLINQHHHLHTLRAILSAISKAQAMAKTIDVDGLDYDKLKIGIGPVPSVQICWRAHAAESASTTPWQPTPSQSFVAASSFFAPPADAMTASTVPVNIHESVTEDREPDFETVSQVETDSATVTATSNATTPPPLPIHAATTESPETPTIPASATPPLPTTPPDPVDPLARFKVMPVLHRKE